MSSPYQGWDHTYSCCILFFEMVLLFLICNFRLEAENRSRLAKKSKRKLEPPILRPSDTQALGHSPL